MSELKLKSEAGASDLTSVVSIVAAYVGNNSVPQTELAAVIASVHTALRQVVEGPRAPTVEPAKEPAVPIKKSVTKEFIICLEDGHKFKSLKRHLATRYDMTPNAYRAKWGLPSDYPMVAPAYAAKRSELAKKIGLGMKAKTPSTSSKGKRKVARKAEPESQAA